MTKITKETDDYVLINWRYPEPYKQYENTPSKEKKFLCLGGIFSGQKKASVQLLDSKQDYVAFNCAENRRWNRNRRGTFVNAKPHTQIWVHKAMLQ